MATSSSWVRTFSAVGQLWKTGCGSHANSSFQNVITAMTAVVFSVGQLCFVVLIIFPRNLVLNLVFQPSQPFCELLNILFEIPF